MEKTAATGSGYKVCFMGASPDTGNMGVSALCASCVKILQAVKPGVNIRLFIGNSQKKPKEIELCDGKKLLQVINYRLTPKAKFHEHLLGIFLIACLQKILPFKALKRKLVYANPFLREMYLSDFVGDIFGGDSFSDIYGRVRFIINIMPALTALLLGKKLVLLPQTYGPYQSFWARLAARFIISRSSSVLCRYRDGVGFVNRLLGHRKSLPPVRFCPDVAFMLDAVQSGQIDMQPPVDFTLHRPLIGFNINGLLYSGGYTRDNMFGLKADYKELVSRIIKRLLEETTGHILLIPHTFGPPGNLNSDPDASQALLKTVDAGHLSRVHLVAREYNQSVLKGIIGRCDFFIGSRMHACIAALSQGVPTVGIAYSHKFTGVFESIGAGESVIDARAEDIDPAVERILLLYAKREEMAAATKARVAEAQKKIMAVFKEMLA